MTVNVTSLPTGSKLFLDAQTSNAPASVQLHPAYEGTFELVSSVVAPAVVVGDEQVRGVGTAEEVRNARRVVARGDEQQDVVRAHYTNIHREESDRV